MPQFPQADPALSHPIRSIPAPSRSGQPHQVPWPGGKGQRHRHFYDQPLRRRPVQLELRLIPPGLKAGVLRQQNHPAALASPPPKVLIELCLPGPPRHIFYRDLGQYPIPLVPPDHPRHRRGLIQRRRGFILPGVERQLPRPGKPRCHACIVTGKCIQDLPAAAPRSHRKALYRRQRHCFFQSNSIGGDIPPQNFRQRRLSIVRRLRLIVQQQRLEPPPCDLCHTSSRRPLGFTFVNHPEKQRLPLLGHPQPGSIGQPALLPRRPQRLHPTLSQGVPSP